MIHLERKIIPELGDQEYLVATMSESNYETIYLYPLGTTFFG
jgi:hypothetical protein